MRQVQRGKKGKKSRKKAEPLAEGIRKRRKQRNWNSMSDEELIEYARKVVRKEGYKEQLELYRADRGLHKILLDRGLFERLGLERQTQDWASMSDDELIEYAFRFIEENRCKGRMDLADADSRLYSALHRRRLIGKIGLDRRRRSWASMSDEAIVAYTSDYLKANGISMRGQLKKIDGSLYGILFKRGLLDAVGLVKLKRDWTSMSDDELVEYAQDFLRENGINGRKGVAKADPGLYSVLSKRKLFDAVGLKSKLRDWESMNDDAIIGFSKEFISKEGITSRSDLAKADLSLYGVLRKRRLLDILFPALRKKRPRDFFTGMSDDELVEYAHGIISERGIGGRGQLEIIDSGLRGVLYKRGLLDRVFSSIEQANGLSGQREAVQQVVDAMKEFDSS